MKPHTLEDLVENFSLFEDWEERYRYLIDLGRDLPRLPEELKTDDYLVRGCTSRVWLVSEVKDGVLHFKADSDAHIVRGLIAFLDVAYQGKPVDALKSIPIEDMFKKVGLDQNLSPNRRSGFYAMVEKIKSYG